MRDEVEAGRVDLRHPAGRWIVVVVLMAMAWMSARAATGAERSNGDLLLTLFHGAILEFSGGRLTPHATSPLPGSADLCFISRTPLPEILASLQREGVAVELGPVRRTGALGPITSVYFRDPDSNLIEVGVEVDSPGARSG